MACGGCLKVTGVLALIFAGLVAYRLQSPEVSGSFPLTSLGPGFSFDEIKKIDTTGWQAIVTGGNTGLGKVNAKYLAQQGAEVVIACRSPARCQGAADELNALKLKGKVIPMQLDLSSLKSVRQFAANYLATGRKLNVLVLNAGIMAPPFTLSEDGIESQFATNHVGHFLLTKLLLPRLEENQPSRVVVLSSAAHYRVPPTAPFGIYRTLEDLNNQTLYNPMFTYGQSKLANIFFGQELAERVADKQIFVNIVHPGAVVTELGRFLAAAIGISEEFFSKITDLLGKWNIMWDVERGTLTQLYTSMSPEIVANNTRGKYFVPLAVAQPTSANGVDVPTQKWLWEFTEALIASRSA